MLLPFLFQDIAGTLATEEAEDLAAVNKLRSALESVDHKRRKVDIRLFLLVNLPNACILLGNLELCPYWNPSRNYLYVLHFFKNFCPFGAERLKRSTGIKLAA